MRLICRFFVLACSHMETFLVDSWSLVEIQVLIFRGVSVAHHVDLGPAFQVIRFHNFLCRTAMQVPVQIPVCLCGLSIYSVADGTIRFRSNANIQLGKQAILLQLNCKFHFLPIDQLAWLRKFSVVCLYLRTSTTSSTFLHRHSRRSFAVNTTHNLKHSFKILTGTGESGLHIGDRSCCI